MWIIIEIKNLYNLIEGSIRHVLSVLSETVSDARAIYEYTVRPTDCDYKQPTELRSSDENHCIGYSDTRRQKKCRETQTGAANAHPANRFKVRPICKDLNTKEFTQLVATRDPAEDGEDLTWYRRSLLHLRNKRQHQLSHYDQADSFCSTTSSVD